MAEFVTRYLKSQFMRRRLCVIGKSGTMKIVPFILEYPFAFSWVLTAIDEHGPTCLTSMRFSLNDESYQRLRSVNVATCECSSVNGCCWMQRQSD